MLSARQNTLGTIMHIVIIITIQGTRTHAQRTPYASGTDTGNPAAAAVFPLSAPAPRDSRKDQLKGDNATTTTTASNCALVAVLANCSRAVRTRKVRA